MGQSEAAEAYLGPPMCAYLVVCTACFAGGIVKGLAGFGSAIIMVLFWVLARIVQLNPGPLSLTVIADSVSTLVAALPLLVMTRAHAVADWRLVTTLLTFKTALSPVGAVLLVVLDRRMVELAMALILIPVIMLTTNMLQGAPRLMRQLSGRIWGRSSAQGDWEDTTPVKQPVLECAAANGVGVSGAAQSKARRVLLPALSAASIPGTDVCTHDRVRSLPLTTVTALTDTAEGLQANDIGPLNNLTESPLGSHGVASLQARCRDEATDPLGSHVSGAPEAAAAGGSGEAAQGGAQKPQQVHDRGTASRENTAGTDRALPQGHGPESAGIDGASRQQQIHYLHNFPAPLYLSSSLSHGLAANGQHQTSTAIAQSCSNVLSGQQQTCEHHSLGWQGPVALEARSGTQQTLGSAGDPDPGHSASDMGDAERSPLLGSAAGVKEPRWPLNPFSQSHCLQVRCHSSSHSSRDGTSGSTPAQSRCAGALRRMWVCAVAYARDEQNRRVVGLGTLAGCASGVMDGMTGMGGPPMMWLYRHLDVQKDVARAVGAVLNIFQVRLIAYLLLGILKRQDALLLVLSCVLHIIGTCLGALVINKHVSQEQFMKLMVALMCICCLLLIAAAAGLAS